MGSWRARKVTSMRCRSERSRKMRHPKFSRDTSTAKDDSTMPAERQLYSSVAMGCWLMKYIN